MTSNPKTPKPAPSDFETLSPATRAIHAADHLSSITDVTPAIHVSTTFIYSNLTPVSSIPPSEHFSSPTQPHVYSRLTAPTNTSLETTLSTLLNGHATTFSSGLAAFTALLIRTNPPRLHLSDGYHGVHRCAAILARLTGMKILPLTPQSTPTKGDLVHIETPQNPYGTAHNISYFSTLTHSAGALLSIDATFGPPPLQDPFAQGADWVLHSASKYFGGHSDMLGGVLVTKEAEEARLLKFERMLVGGMMGSLEQWLELRSLKTLELRVKRQADNATKLVELLKEQEGGIIEKVYHVSLQDDWTRGEPWIKAQMPNGGGPVFSLLLKTEEAAKRLPENLKLWMHAPSLGGVESLVEWRAMSDATADMRLLRFSVGIEGVEDLWADLETGLKTVEGL